mgnify:FL=1
MQRIIATIMFGHHTQTRRAAVHLVELLKYGKYSAQIKARINGSEGSITLSTGMNEIAVELTAYPKFRKAELIVKIGFMKFTPPPFTNKLFINLTRRFFS